MQPSRNTFRLSSAYKLLATVLILALTACGTTRITQDQSSVADFKYVPCSKIKITPFHAPVDSSSPPESAANIYDTPETIEFIRPNNAAIREACR